MISCAIEKSKNIYCENNPYDVKLFIFEIEKYSGINFVASYLPFVWI